MYLLWTTPKVRQIVTRMGNPYFLLPAAPNRPDPELSINSNFNCDIKIIKSQTESGNNLENNINTITVAVMNCQSIKNKKAVFNLFVDEHQLDIIIGSESWISPAAHSSEFLLIIISTGKIKKMAMEGYSFCAVRGCLVRIYHLLQHVKWLCAVFGCSTQAPWLQLSVQYTDLLAVTVCTWSNCVKHWKR